MRWWLPDAGSTFAGPIDTLFLAILIITGIALVVVEVGLVTFVIRYRARPGRKAFYTHGSTRAEVIWTAIPAVTMVALGLVSNHYWVLIKDRKSIPPNAYHLGVHAKQDAVPGMHITAWFQATKTGEFELGCAELCGMGHYKMRARVFVHTPDEYKTWVAQQVAGGSE